MVNVDMIGDSSGDVSALGAGRSSLASAWVRSAALAYGITVKTTRSAGGGSDHYYFALKGVPYVFFHTGISPCYHTSCDTADKIHYPQLTQITRSIAHLLWTVAQSDKSPRSDFVSYTLPSPVDTSDWRRFLRFFDHR